jgi:glutaredoxin
MKEMVIYSTRDCPSCRALKAAMPPLSFKTVDMSTPEGLTELRINGVFVLEAPILRIDDDFYYRKDLFDADGNVNRKKVNEIIEG